jgi:hypothetical protein
MRLHPAPRPAPGRTLLHPSHTVLSYAERRRTEYLVLSGLLTVVPAGTCARHRHPAHVLDLATGPRTSVWGWWAEPVGGESPVPCLLWAGELGWSAAAVEADTLDGRGYATSSWSQRATLLDLALANATGPFRTVDQLCQRVSDDVHPDLGDRSAAVAGALLWGILQQQAARTRLGHVATGSRVPRVAVRGVVDDALDRGHLSPDRVKVRLERPDVGLDGLLRAVEEVRAGARHRKSA